MFTSIPSLDAVVQCLLPAFTQPSFQTHIEVLIGWVMCLSKRTEYGVFQTIEADTLVSRQQRHPFDRFYNFFSRSAWIVRDLAHQVAMAVVVQLNPRGLLYLVVDDTLLHKRGKNVYGLGWFRDAVASTAKRVATASGNHWVVVGLAICIPGTTKIYCLPIHAMLHLAGKNQKSEATLAKEMLRDILEWFPDRKLVFLGDGAYSTKNLLDDLDPRVTYVGVMRSDAAIYDPLPPKQSTSKRGPKAKKGPRLPNPKEAMKKADRNRMFASGKADLSVKAQPVIAKVAEVVRDVPNVINVEGYTDDVPISNGIFPSNRDLSSARATSVVKELVKNNISPQRLSSVGYGEFHPIADNKDEEGRFKNRRVVLVLMSQAFSRYGMNDEQRAKALNFIPTDREKVVEKPPQTPVPQ